MKYLYDCLSRVQSRAIVPAVAVFETLRKAGDRFLAETHDLLGTVQPPAVLAGLAREVDALRTGMAKVANAVSKQLRAAAGAVTVSFADAPRSCTLATAGAVAGFEAAGWTVQAAPETRGTCRLECADGELRFVVVPNGTAIFIR